MTERDDRQKVTLPNSFFLNQGIVDPPHKKLDVRSRVQVVHLEADSRHEGASPVAQMVKNLPAMQETQVRSLG